MTVKDVSKDFESSAAPVPPPAPVVSANGGEVLIALGVSVTAPLFGCGGGGGSSAVAPPPSGTPPPAPTPTPTPTPTPPPAPPPPTVTFDATATPGLTPNLAYLTGSAAVNPVFTFNGAAPSLITQFSPVFPRTNMVSPANSTADTFAPGTVYTTFLHTGMALDSAQYGFTANANVYIDDNWYALYGQALTSGVAQGGGASTITLASSSS